MTTEIAAGRELDVLIATEVMGWMQTGECEWRLGDQDYWEYHFPPDAYSTTYEGMGLVLERMREEGAVVYITAGPFGVSVNVDNSIDVDAATLPHAVCLAALKAVRA